MARPPATNMSKLLQPSSVAVVGASPRTDASGHIVLKNLLTIGFEGPIYPVNPRHKEVLGQRCYASLNELPETVDAAFLAVPAASGPELVKQAVACGIGALCINANGYADGGSRGAALQSRLSALAERYGLAVCGPNNMGLVNLWRKAALWMSDLPSVEPGPIAIVSQSGSVAIALSQDPRGLGLGYIITVGNEAVCDMADYIAFLASDNRIRTLILFIETLRRPAAFAEAVRSAMANGKRVLAVKVGRSEAAQAAVANHSGALAGEDKVVAAFFRHHGVIQLRDLDEMLEAGVLLSAYPDPPRSGNLVAVTLSGGEAAMIADLAETLGLHLRDFAAGTKRALREILPSVSAASNPLDAWGQGWDAAMVSRLLTTLTDDQSIGPIVCFGDPPLSGGNDADYVRELAGTMAKLSIQSEESGSFAERRNRMILVNNLATVGTHPEVAAQLRPAGIPYLRGTRTALAAIKSWLAFAPPEPERPTGPYPGAARLQELANAGPLRDRDIVALLDEAGLPMSPFKTVHHPDQLPAVVAHLGYPVAIKASVPGLTHKTELDLVRLSLKDERALGEAAEELWAAMRQLPSDRRTHELLVQPMAENGIELFVAVRNNPNYGSIVLVGLGGLYVETLRDVSFRIGPVDERDAERMLCETHATTLLSGLRGAAASDSPAAAAAIAALSRFGVATADCVASVEINPLIVLPEGRGAVAVDAVLELRGATS